MSERPSDELMQQTYLEMCEARAKCNALIKDIESFKRFTYFGHAVFWMSGMMIGAYLTKLGWIAP